MQINLKQHKKLYGLLAVLALCFLLSGVYLVQTLQLWGQTGVLEKRLEEAALAHSLIATERLQIKKLDREIQTLQSRDVTIGSHVEFLNYTEQLCEDLELKLLDLPTEEVESLDGYQLAHIRMRLTGEFHALLQFLYRVEQSDRSASISRSDLRLQDIRTRQGRKQVLTLAVTLNRLLDSPQTQNL